MNRLNAISLIASTAAIHWGYSGPEGPKDWSELEPDFLACGGGKLQSPINLTSPVHAEIGSISLNYKTAPLRIINNGHTVQCNWPSGSTLRLRGRSYELAQFHFHIPSEHRVSGKRYAMELHFVHFDAGKNAAVLGVLLQQGSQNDTLAQIWEHMPMVAGPERTISNVSIDPTHLIPTAHPYFEYLGSLTTPPCSENVTWIVLATPQQLSRAQIDKFHHAYAMNARPIQGINQRLLLESD